MDHPVMKLLVHKLTERVSVHPERKGVDVPRLLDLARRLEEGRRVGGDLSGGAEEEDAGRLGLRLRGVLQEDAAVIAGQGDVFHGSVVYLQGFVLDEGFDL